MQDAVINTAMTDDVDEFDHMVIHAVEAAHRRDVVRRKQLWSVMMMACDLPTDARMSAFKGIVTNAVNASVECMVVDAGWSCLLKDEDERTHAVLSMIRYARREGLLDELYRAALDIYGAPPPAWVPWTMIQDGAINGDPRRLGKTVREVVFAVIGNPG